MNEYKVPGDAGYDYRTFEQDKLLLTAEEIDKVLHNLAEEQVGSVKVYESTGRNPLVKPKHFSQLDRFNAICKAQLAKVKQRYERKREGQGLSSSKEVLDYLHSPMVEQKKLDRPDRNKIANAITVIVYNWQHKGLSRRERDDQILALIPDIEEARFDVETRQGEYWSKMVVESVERAKKQEKLNTLRELRDMWAYELASGHPVMSINLDKWIKYCQDAGIEDDWWELKEQ